MKNVRVLLSAALVIAGIAAIVAVAARTKNAARADDWVQARATVERVDGASVTYRYESGAARHRVTAPGRPRVVYAAGAPVLAYVNPSNAAESLLELPTRPSPVPAVAGGVAILLGTALGLFFWRADGTPAKKKAAPKRPGAAAPMSRLQPPPPVKWNRGEDATGPRPPRPAGDDTTPPGSRTAGDDTTRTRPPRSSS